MFMQAILSNPGSTPIELPGKAAKDAFRYADAFFKVSAKNGKQT